MRTIRPFDELGRGDVAVAGGKGANLGELTRAGLPVPPGFVVTTEAYRAFLAETGIGEQVLALAAVAPDAAPEAYESAAAKIRDLFRSADVPDALARQVRDAATQLGDAPLAVRSSATAEDLEDASFAGQQDTYLDVQGADRLLAAVRDCWASLWTARAMAYRARRGIDPAQVALAVVVQRMVDADAAGVMFTANPTNGRRNETVISAAWGLGESVVSGTVTTDDVVVEMPDGRVLSRTTADKAVMVVPTGHGAEERPVPQDRRGRRVLDDAAAVELARLGARVADHFGAPQDVEWARSGPGGEFWLVQARPVTALPEPEAPAPTDWSVPDPKSAYYMRASIVEQLPDPLSPLFADLVDGSVTRSLQALFREFVGRDIVDAGDIGLPTVNGYAYYRYSRAGLRRIMLRSPAALRTVVTPGDHGAQTRWRDHSHPLYVQAVESWTGRPLGELTVPQLLDGVVALLDAATEYYTSVQTIIPIAVTSEVLFTSYYDRLVRRAGDPPASTFLLGFDSLPIRAEKSLHEIGTWAAAHDDLAAALRTAPTTAADGGNGRVDPATWQEWRTRFGAHLERYGHTVYNLDFLNAVPADDPTPLLETLRFYLDGGGADPNERQRRAAERREEATAAVLARLDPVRRAGFVRLLRWAQSAAPVREDALGDVGLAWPQLRRMLREIGARLVAAGRIDRADDVFWVRRDEVLSPDEGSLRDEVEARKEIWRGRRRATPPQILPVGTWWEAFEGMFPAASADQTGDVIRGIGASAGKVTAPARVLGGPADFGRMRPGDVLVAGITTPAWTPLFPMASAVVTDVGGPLSHSSIVAREYGIPAVLGTAVATRRITDGAQIYVDGDAGTVTLIGDGTPTAEAAAPAEPAPVLGRSSAVALGAAAVGGAALAAAWWRSRRRGRGE